MRAAHLTSRLLVLTAAALALSHLARAEDVSMPAGSAAEAPAPAPVITPITTPSRGALMNKVEAQFGAPTERHGAVGNPPITRWDYPGFSVFFERDHVIHSVVR
jgi:hypothetical protein